MAVSFRSMLEHPRLQWRSAIPDYVPSLALLDVDGSLLLRARLWAVRRRVRWGLGQAKQADEGAATAGTSTAVGGCWTCAWCCCCCPQDARRRPRKATQPAPIAPQRAGTVAAGAADVVAAGSRAGAWGSGVRGKHISSVGKGL